MDELVKVLRETDFSDGCPCGAEPMCKDRDCVILQAAEAIEELMRRCEQFQYMPPPAWIPVTDRLPEIDMSYPHHEDYLVQYDSGNMDVASWSNVNRFWTDHVTEPHWNCVQFAEVIAWMPLPKPWKEK